MAHYILSGNFSLD